MQSERPGEEIVEEMDGIPITRGTFNVIEEEITFAGTEIRLHGRNMGGSEETLELVRYSDGTVTVGLGSLDGGAEFSLPNQEILERALLLLRENSTQSSES